MTATERATLLTDLYALRAQAAAKQQAFCQEHLLGVAAFCAMAVQSFTEAIDALQTHNADVRHNTDRQTQFFPH